MDLKELKRIIGIFQKAKIAELEVESKDGVRFKLKKEVKERQTPPPKEVPVEVISVPAQSVEQKKAEEAKFKAGFHEILSPMIGTFYVAPSPDSPPFVSVGQEVKEDDTVCILEAMKIMNEIKADIKGKIVKVLVENGNPVEFGQPLFLVELTVTK